MSANFKVQPHICQCNIAFMWFFYIIGVQYLHVRHPGKISPSELIFQIIIKCGAHAQNSKSHCFIFLLFLNQCYSNKLWKHHPKKYKESFLIVVSSWNRDLMLMLERPLSHYWTSPLIIIAILGPSWGCLYKTESRDMAKRYDDINVGAAGWIYQLNRKHCPTSRKKEIKCAVTV